MRKEVGALVGAFVLIFACLLVVGFGWLVCDETCGFVRGVRFFTFVSVWC
jgi:hypothetical protein